MHSLLKISCLNVTIISNQHQNVDYTGKLNELRIISFILYVILTPACKYCHMIKDFIIWEHL